MHIRNFAALLFFGLHLAACGQNSKTGDNAEKTQIKSTEMEKKMKVEVWSDVVCPFCYIGKRKFETALAKFADKDNVQVIWKSYQLIPDMPTNPGKTVYQVVSEKHGISLEQSKSMHDKLTQTAKEVGLVYNFDKAVPVNTLKAHQLIQFAKAQGKQETAEEALFQAYFTEGKNIDDVPTLLELGTSIGLYKAALKDALERRAYASDVQADIEEAQQVGVQGVPFFVFDRKYAVSGAQDPTAFLETLQKAFATWRKENPVVKLEVTEGKTCNTGWRM